MPADHPLELKYMLDKLDAGMTAMMAEHPEDEFWIAFAGPADAILDAAGAADYDWAAGQLDEILRRHGKPVTPDDPPTDNWPVASDP